jgi:hypothetical protein
VSQLDYHAKLGSLPEALRSKWVRLENDAETQVYLSRCLNRPRFLRHAMGVRPRSGSPPLSSW